MVNHNKYAAKIVEQTCIKHWHSISVHIIQLAISFRQHNGQWDRIKSLFQACGIPENIGLTSTIKNASSQKLRNLNLEMRMKFAWRLLSFLLINDKVTQLWVRKFSLYQLWFKLCDRIVVNYYSCPVNKSVNKFCSGNWKFPRDSDWQKNKYKRVWYASIETCDSNQERFSWFQLVWVSHI